MPKTFMEGEETLAQQAQRALRERILNGALLPGQRLPLRPLASELGMSLAPVGEALRELAREGLLETEPGWGSRVRRLDSDALRSQHILRTALECEAVRHCAERIAPAQINELHALAKKLDSLIDSHGDWVKAAKLDSAFHYRIAQLSGVRVLAELLRSNQLVRMLVRGGAIAHELERPQRQHLQLVEAIRTGDADAAEAAMRLHCRNSMELQLFHLSSREMQDPERALLPAI